MTAPHDGTTVFAADAAARRHGIELLEAAPGAATLRMAVTAEMANGHGIAHGGYVFLLADTAFACACNSRGVAVAAGADITYAAPAHVGDVLVARAEERVCFGRNGVYDVSVLRGTEVIAEFRGRSRIVRDPSTGAKGAAGAARTTRAAGAAERNAANGEHRGAGDENGPEGRA